MEELWVTEAAEDGAKIALRRASTWSKLKISKFGWKRSQHCDNITYPLANYTLPTTGWKEIIVQATESGTDVSVDGVPVGEFRVNIDDTTTNVPLAFVAPVHIISGELQRFTLWDGLVSV